eukprot:COSAG01_NODE_1043_length_11954_cov_9.077014_14_plen_261_part_00
MGAQVAGSLPAKLRTRNRIVHEIIQTEAAYVGALRQLMTEFREPCKGVELSNTGRSEQHANVVFANLDSLLPCQENFLAELQGESDKIGQSGAIGRVFVAFAPYFRMYTAYVSNYTTALLMIVKLKKRPEFRGILASAQERGVPGLEDLLITPVQRLPRYKMLLQELLAQTPVSHFCACIGSPCLRQCVHGAPIGGALRLHAAGARHGAHRARGDGGERDGAAGRAAEARDRGARPGECDGDRVFFIAGRDGVGAGDGVH